MTDLFLWNMIRTIEGKIDGSDNVSFLLLLFFILLFITFIGFNVEALIKGDRYSDISTTKGYIIEIISAIPYYIFFVLFIFIGSTIIGLCINWNLFITWFIDLQICGFVGVCIFGGVIFMGIGIGIGVPLCFIIEKIKHKSLKFTKALEKIVIDW